MREQFQVVKEISIEELVLWTENPRDTISECAQNEQIIKAALQDKKQKWKLKTLASEMGEYYDQSELPIVVYRKGVPVVYDGNRRVILGKIKNGDYCLSKDEYFRIPSFPKMLPCCVTDEATALKSVWRKHADSGSWDQLSRDIFLHRFMGEKKSLFLILNESLNNRIAESRLLNQRFVKEEVLTENSLARLGIFVKDGRIFSRCSLEDTQKILLGVLRAVEDKDITTRKNRNTVLDALSEEIKSIVALNAEHDPTPIAFDVPRSNYLQVSPRRNKDRLSRRVDIDNYPIFGKKLFLIPGDVSNLYRDICDLFNFFQKNKKKLSDKFPMLIRMSLRLISELASETNNSKGLHFIKNSFDEAKARLGEDEKTFLSAHAVSKEKILELLHIGAHNYTASVSMEQTLAISIIIGRILEINFGKKN